MPWYISLSSKSVRPCICSSRLVDQLSKRSRYPHTLHLSSHSSSRIPTGIPRPDLILPVRIHPPSTRIRERHALILEIVHPVRRDTLARSPAANGIVARAEGAWSSRRWGHPEVHLSVFGGAEGDGETGWDPVAGEY